MREENEGGMAKRRRIVLGTRGSALALWQSEWVAATLRRLAPAVDVEITRISSVADRQPETPIADLGTKGVFTKTLEDALFDGRIDMAVHSLKDLASVLPPGLILAAVPPREDPRDVLVSSMASSLETLPPGARVGSSAPRRVAQLAHLRPDLVFLPIRGNVDTRLRKLDDGDYDALILAAAGLHRLGHGARITTYIDTASMLPAGGQGALGIEVRGDAPEILALLARLNDAATAACVTAERRLQAVLEGGCRVPIGALAQVASGGDTLTLDAVVASEDGRDLIRASLSGPLAVPAALGDRLAAVLLEKGAGAILTEDRTR